MLRPAKESCGVPLSLSHCHSRVGTQHNDPHSTQWPTAASQWQGRGHQNSRRTNREAKTVALGQRRSHPNARPTKNHRAFARGVSGPASSSRYCATILATFVVFVVATETADTSSTPSAADLRANYPQFFWKVVAPYTGDALRYLRVTQEGQQWVANLYANVFATEHRGQIG